MTSFILKLIALISMTIDHTAYVLFDNNLTMRFLGRIAFPLYAFLLVQGFLHTKDDPQRIKKYLLRTGLFALISEIPFDLCFNHAVLEFGYQNVFFTLFLGLASLYFMDFLNKKGKDGFFAIFPFAIINYFSAADYRVVGIVFFFALYYIEKIGDNKKGLKAFSIVLLTIIMSCIEILLQGDFTMASTIAEFKRYAWVYTGIILSSVPMLMYNGKLGKKSKALQIMFYIYYPLHLLIIHLINTLAA